MSLATRFPSKDSLTSSGGIDIAGLVLDVANTVWEVVKDIFEAVEKQHEAQDKFTQSFVQTARERYPGKNALAICVGHDRNFQNASHEHTELRVSLGRTVGYECYVFDSGTLTKRGDGGFINWCFNGSYKRDGDHVEFYKIPGTYLWTSFRDFHAQDV